MRPPTPRRSYRGAGIIAFRRGEHWDGTGPQETPLEGAGSVCIVEKADGRRSFPNGGIVDEESLVQCAVREWEEQTGIPSARLQIVLPRDQDHQPTAPPPDIACPTRILRAPHASIPLEERDIAGAPPRGLTALRAVERIIATRYFAALCDDPAGPEEPDGGVDGAANARGLLKRWAPPRPGAIRHAYWVDVRAALTGRFAIGTPRGRRCAPGLLREAWGEITAVTRAAGEAERHGAVEEDPSDVFDALPPAASDAFDGLPAPISDVFDALPAPSTARGERAPSMCVSGHTNSGRAPA